MKISNNFVNYVNESICHPLNRPGIFSYNCGVEGM